jgi:hypothetical protein
VTGVGLAAGHRWPASAASAEQATASTSQAGVQGLPTREREREDERGDCQPLGRHDRPSEYEERYVLGERDDCGDNEVIYVRWDE